MHSTRLPINTALGLFTRTWTSLTRLSSRLSARSLKMDFFDKYEAQYVTVPFVRRFVVPCIFTFTFCPTLTFIAYNSSTSVIAIKFPSGAKSPNFVQHHSVFWCINAFFILQLIQVIRFRSYFFHTCLCFFQVRLCNQ